MCGGEICITLEQTIDWWYFPTAELQREEQIGNTYSDISLIEVEHYNIYVIVLLLPRKGPSISKLELNAI